MPEVKIDIDIYCSCGAPLCMQAEGGYGRITVEPCEKCLQEAKDESYDEGHEAGYSVGYDAGIGD